MSGGDRLSVTFMRQQLNKPGLVFNFFNEDAGSHVVGPRILAKGHIADRAPASDRTALRLQQQGENIHYRGRIWQLCCDTSSLVMKFWKTIGQVSAQFINTRNNQLPMGAVFQPRVLADFLVVLVASQVHAKNSVVVIRAGKLSCGVGNQHFDQLFYVYAASADDLNTDALSHVAWFYCILSSHKNVLFLIEFPIPRMLLLPAGKGRIANSVDFHRDFLYRDRRCEMDIDPLR